MTWPLRSTPITGASSLLRASPPARPATVLNPSRFQPAGTLPLAALAGRPYQGTPSPVPRESSRSDSRRLHAGHRLASKRAPARLIPEQLVRSGFDVTRVYFDTSSANHLRSSFRSLPDAFYDTFSHSLTTTVFGQCSSGRFEAFPRRTAPKGHSPSSFTQHRIKKLYLHQASFYVRDTHQHKPPAQHGRRNARRGRSRCTPGHLGNPVLPPPQGQTDMRPKTDASTISNQTSNRLND